MVAADLPRPEVPVVVAVLRDFVNTTDRETGTDELGSRAELSRYLVREGLLPRPERATTSDFELALRLRRGLRRALELNHDSIRVGLPELAEALRELPVGLDWRADVPALRPTARGVRGALARIGLAAHESATADLWWRLKICAFDECEWAYFDHSKNRSRHYCEYGCGNKLKTRAYRARQRQPQPLG